MKWIHILEKQPENNSVIIQIDPPYELYDEADFKKHYSMGMRHYKTYGTWENYMEYCKDNDHYPNFWWIYAKDFPFPEFDEKGDDGKKEL